MRPLLPGWRAGVSHHASWEALYLCWQSRGSYRRRGRVVRLAQGLFWAAILARVVRLASARLRVAEFVPVTSVPGQSPIWKVQLAGDREHRICPRGEAKTSFNHTED